MVDFGEARQALGAEVARLTSLLRSVRTPATPAVGRWNVAELAVHLSQAFLVVPGLAAQDLSRAFEAIPGLTSTDGGGIIGDLWDLGATTVRAVESDPERDPTALADLIDRRAADFLRDCAGGSGREPRPWLVNGVEVELSTLACHLLSETLVHGRDMAVAEGRPWTMKRSHCALAVDGFLMPVMASLGSRTMVDQERSAGFRACYDIRVRGGGRHFMVLDDGALTVEAPSDRRVDCHLSVDPAGFLLVGFHRVSQWRAIARGQLLAWGRRPWVGVRLAGLVRTP